MVIEDIGQAVTDECKDPEQTINNPDAPAEAAIAGVPAGIPLEGKVLIEFGFDPSLKAYAMCITFPNSGNCRVNFNLNELRSMREQIVKLIDHTTA